jgi:hypothetical protein
MELQEVRSDASAIDERPVAAPEVVNPVAILSKDDARMLARDPCVRENDVIVRTSTDQQGALERKRDSTAMPIRAIITNLMSPSTRLYC